MGFDKRFFAVKISLHNDSSVVQSVERRTVNPYVTGSSPVRGARFKEARFLAGFLLFGFRRKSTERWFVEGTQLARVQAVAFRAQQVNGANADLQVLGDRALIETVRLAGQFDLAMQRFI